MARVAIAEFGVIQKSLAGASVAVYVANADGSPSATLATLYEADAGSAQVSNPQVLDENGKLALDCFVEQSVVAEISNINDTISRSIKKIKVNPLQYALPVTVASLEAANTDGAVEAATTAAGTATAQAVIATTQAGIATTQATTATTQAGTATTQASTATTKAAEAAASAAAAAASAAGMKQKNPVRAATTGALPACTYANGASGVGATLTANANGVLPTQDGVTLLNGEGLLVKDQVATLQAGLYVVTDIGSGGTPWILTRQTDSDTWNEIVAAVVTVTEGTVYSDTDFLCTSNAGGTMGTNAITWQAYNSTIADGAVSTAAKIVDGIITYAKTAAAAIASVSDITNGVASKWVNAATLKAWWDALVEAPDFTSAELTVTYLSSQLVAHGLGARPSQIEVWIRFKASVGGYVSGDEILAPVPNVSGGNYYGVQPCIDNGDTANIRVTCGLQIATVNKTTGAGFLPAAADMRYIVRAWK